jgi:hypothetical protein
LTQIDAALKKIPTAKVGILVSAQSTAVKQSQIRAQLLVDRT